MVRVGFVQSKYDPSLFIYNKPDGLAYLLLYVDDIAITAFSTALRTHLTSLLINKFSMTDLGELHYFLSIAIKRNVSGFFLT